MANRYYTIMIIPERSSKVRKWVLSNRTVKWTVTLAACLFVMGTLTSFMTLRYLAKRGEFEQALLKNHHLEGQLAMLENKMATADSTLLRVQNFEQKLRVLAQVDRQLPSNGGIGPISGEEERILLGSGAVPTSNVLLASVPETASNMRSKSLELTVDHITSRASLQEQSLQELYELLRDQQSLLAATPSIWPAQGWVTSQFGYRVSPLTGARQLHDGLDIAAPVGTKVYAAANGVVTRTGSEEGYGKVVAINHGYGLVTRYAHNSEVLVKVGQKVKRGDSISLIGNTGRATGPHLHYEVRVNGIPVNPMRYVLN